LVCQEIALQKETPSPVSLGLFLGDPGRGKREASIPGHLAIAALE
jgi:hypothetical protein